MEIMVVLSSVFGLGFVIETKMLPPQPLLTQRIKSEQAVPSLQEWIHLQE